MQRIDFLLLFGKMGIAIADLGEAEMEREFSQLPKQLVGIRWIQSG